MQVEEITQILRESPSVRLIKIKKCGFLLVFCHWGVWGTVAIMQERLHMLLENRLDEQENALVEDNLEMTRLGESNEQKAKRTHQRLDRQGILDQLSERRGRGDIRDFVAHKQTDGLGGEAWKKRITSVRNRSSRRCLPNWRNWWNTRTRTARSDWNCSEPKNGDRASDSATGDGRRGRGVWGLPDRTTIQ